MGNYHVFALVLFCVRFELSPPNRPTGAAHPGPPAPPSERPWHRLNFRTSLGLRQQGSGSSAPTEKIICAHHIPHHPRLPNPTIPTHSICRTSRLWRFQPTSPHFDTSSTPTPPTSFPPTPAYRKAFLHHSAGTHDTCTLSHMAQHIWRRHVHVVGGGWVGWRGQMRAVAVRLAGLHTTIEAPCSIACCACLFILH